MEIYHNTSATHEAMLYKIILPRALINVQLELNLEGLRGILWDLMWILLGCQWTPINGQNCIQILELKTFKIGALCDNIFACNCKV